MNLHDNADSRYFYGNGIKLQRANLVIMEALGALRFKKSIKELLNDLPEDVDDNEKEEIKKTILDLDKSKIIKIIGNKNKLESAKYEIINFQKASEIIFDGLLVFKDKYNDLHKRKKKVKARK
ncbi:MAG: hypothetical protein JSV56_00795 [Methanomassiliicoccales archaeon]|nr:MAG: hypothetical protein JSV56_00795 [Methanomassiliicoccales archaeon]